MAKQKTPESILKSFVISTLRRASYRWKPRTQALRDARIERGLYQCNLCKGTFKHKEIRVDHIEPVVPLTGFSSWDDYISRLFCDSNGLQIICLQCHSSKSFTEKEIRKINRKKLTTSKK